MAYSSSVIRAQAIKLCELCNEDNIKWRCIDCDRCLCQKCKTIHLKVPVTAKHQIVTISTPIKEVKRKIVTDNIPCKDHVTNMTLMFCETCACLVCPECVSTSHTKHEFTQIEKALDSKLEQLQGIKIKVSDNLKLCDSKSLEIQNLVPKYNSIFDESVKKIKQKEQELKEAVSKYSKHLQEKVEAERSKMKSRVTKVEQDVTGARKKFQDLQEELETALASNQGQVIFETSVTQPVLKFDPFPLKVEHFISKANTERQIEELFGSFKIEMISTVESLVGFEVLRTLTTDLPLIQQLIPLGETSAWISCKTSNKSVLRKVTIQDNNIITSKEISLKSHDMALTSDNDILLTVVGEFDVKLMTNSGEIKSVLEVAHIFPYGIHVTSDNRVIVGVLELVATNTSTDQRQSAVVVFGIDCKQEHKYQKDKDGNILFTYPCKITTNNNQEILVIDRTSNKTGRVVTLDREGNLRWIYEGHFKINVTKQFHPTGITTTRAGYIIVSDYYTHTLHILSESGDVLTCKFMDDMGIKYPYGLNTDKAGKVWVGCDSLEGSGAKLHIVKLLI